MSNPINNWIRGDSTPAGKKKRRLIVAVVFAVIAVVAAPFTMGISLALLVVTLVKIKNAMTDES